MELLWNMLLVAVASLPIILCIGLFLLLTHMTFISKRNIVVVLAILCVLASYLSAYASIYHTVLSRGTSGTTGGKCPKVEWFDAMFTSFGNDAYPEWIYGYPGWITITPVTSNLATCIMISYELAKPQHIGINFILIWTAYILVMLAMSFHSVAVYMLILCSKVYSSKGCAVFVLFTGFLAVISVYLELCTGTPQHSPPRPRPLRYSPTHSPLRPLQQSPRRMLFAPLSQLKDVVDRIRALILGASQEAGVAKEERHSKPVDDIEQV